MRPDLDAIRARCDTYTTIENELYLARRVPVLLDYIQRLEGALDAIAMDVIPPKPSPPGTRLLLSQTAQEFALGVLSLPPQKETAP